MVKCRNRDRLQRDQEIFQDRRGRYSVLAPSLIIQPLQIDKTTAYELRAQDKMTAIRGFICIRCLLFIEAFPFRVGIWTILFVTAKLFAIHTEVYFAAYSSSSA